MRILRKVWKSVHRKSLTGDEVTALKTRSGFRRWGGKWAEAEELKVHITVNPKSEEGCWLGNMQCQEHETAPGKRDCPVKWRYEIDDMKTTT